MLQSLVASILINYIWVQWYEIWCWRRVLQVPWPTKKRNKWVLEQTEPETTLAIWQKWRNWSCPTSDTSGEGRVLRRDNNAGKIEGSGKRGRWTSSWIDPMKEAVGGSLRSWQGCWGRGTVGSAHSQGGQGSEGMQHTHGGEKEFWN